MKRPNVSDLQQVFPELPGGYAALSHMNPYRALQQIWQPGAQALESLTVDNPAAVLGRHWRAATQRVEQLFWSTPISWLKYRPAAMPAAGDHHLTSGGRLIR
jgi:hypothetical protein